MSQQFCTLQGPTEPLALSLVSPGLSRLTLIAPINVFWDGGTIDLWNPEIAFSVLALPDRATTFSSDRWVWLLVAVAGDPTHGYLVPEHDYANLDTLLPGATWAVIYRIYGTDIALFQQAGSGTAGIPGTITGDILYWDNTAHAWTILHIS